MHNNKHSEFIEFINSNIDGSSKKWRELVDWKVIAKEMELHYNTLVNYLAGRGPDVLTMTGIIVRAYRQIGNIKSEIEKRNIQIPATV